MRTAFIIFVLFLILSLHACSNHETISTIEAGDFAKALFVQKVENSTSKEELTKMITDPAKIKAALDLVDGLLVKETTSDKVLKMMKAEDTYMFYFSKTDEMVTGKVPYAFYILGDGHVIFTHGDEDELLVKPLITAETHEDLLEEVRQGLNIDF
ncbi:hypothetical protein ACQ0QQ_00620 [Lysinibacillus sphaericus]